MTAEEIQLCKKADAAVGEILAANGVPRYEDYVGQSAGGYLKSLVRRWLLSLIFGLCLAWLYRRLTVGAVVINFNLVGGVIAVSFVILLFVEIISGVANDSMSKMQARWLRIGKLLHSMWGEGGWQVPSVELLRLKVLAHLELELWNDEGPSLPLARRIALKAWQIEQDLHLSLVPVTEKGESRGEPAAKPGVA